MKGYGGDLAVWPNEVKQYAIRASLNTCSLLGGEQTNWTRSRRISVTPSAGKSQALLKIKRVELTHVVRQRGQSASVTVWRCFFLAQTGRHTRGGEASDPLHIAEDEDEQGPEEHSDDSGPDEDYDLHVGLITWTLTGRKEKKTYL